VFDISTGDGILLNKVQGWYIVDFQILGTVDKIEVIASGHGIRHLSRLDKFYGRANWRKMKGFARIRLSDGAILDAELHWYEGHGIGKKEIKIKRYLI